MTATAGQTVEQLQYKIQRNDFDIKVLQLKLQKAKAKFEDEKSYLLEQLRRGPLKYDLTRKMELQIKIDDAINEILEGYKERQDGALAVIQAREQFRIKTLEAQLQLEQVD